MPTYGYRCASCSYEFEELQKITDDPLVHCPSCHKDTLKRIIGSGAGLMFKGSGFYLTDYKKTSSSSSAPAANSKAKKSESETKSDAKPESKPDSKSETKSDSKPKKSDS